MIKNKDLIKITVITTAWNRGKLIENVYKSLLTQEKVQLEWIVCNDGSSDETDEKINEFIEKKEIKIVYINSKTRVGKAVLDNEAINNATGKYITWCDSDDILLKNCLNEMLLEIERAEEDVIGVIGCCSTDKNITHSRTNTGKTFLTSWWELNKTHEWYGDSVIFLRTEIIKKFRFPEVDYVVPESSVWCHLKHEKVIAYDKKIMIKNYKSTSNSISFSNKIRYIEGNIEAKKITTRVYFEKFKQKITLKEIINYYRYYLHTDRSISKAHEDFIAVEKNKNVRYLIIISIIYFLIDKILNKVEKNEIDFNKIERQIKIHN